ncbi:DUF1028 domain-containing protein [Ancylobacter sonchi]|uniref:DUF1028 domain-containing protein n=1 Tax=Ancylobacter sonchi TaxID=1937790 RepID=UPI001BD4DDEF|nr:DUF1028 domain-containing protein [Ancylobacter sonchi]MBS7532667.1 DUF1028 domain-containing protein [Ancylobacter sonchi]
MTFTLVARCRDTGMLGIAVSSSSPAVASRCIHARAGIGAFATQNFTDPTLGRRGLDLMEKGASAAQAIDIVSATASDAPFRQLAAIGLAGVPAGFTGASCLDKTAECVGADCVAVGNLLSSNRVPAAMVAAFEAATDHLAGRLITGLAAGLAAGGEVEMVRSAGVIVVADLPWPVADLRVDWHEDDPIAELGRHWAVWEPRMPLYHARALRPAEAPASDDV